MNNSKTHSTFLSRASLILILAAFTVPFMLNNESLAIPFIIITSLLSVTLALLSRKELPSKITLSLAAIALVVGSINYYIYQKTAKSASQDPIDELLEANKEELHLKSSD